MDAKWQTFFFVVAILCWVAAAGRPSQGAIRWSSSQWMCLGFVAFAVPFAYNAAVAGW